MVPGALGLQAGPGMLEVDRRTIRTESMDTTKVFGSDSGTGPLLEKPHPEPDPIQGIGTHKYGTQEVRRLKGGKPSGAAAAQILACSYRSGPGIDFGSFAARIHRPGTGAAFFEGSKQELLQRIREGWNQRKPGIGQTGLDKVILVPFADPTPFRSNSVELNPSVKLTATFETRRSHEMPFIKVRATAAPEPADTACAVLYSKEALLAHGEKPSGDGDWEVVKIIAGPTTDEPMDPYTMARNLLGLPGGNPDVTYTPEQFAEAVVHWAGRALRAGDPKKKKKNQTPAVTQTASSLESSRRLGRPAVAVHVPASKTTPALVYDPGKLGQDTGPIRWVAEPETLLEQVQKDWHRAETKGDGTVVVPMSDPSGFRKTVAPLEPGDQLSAFFEPKGPGGMPSVEVRVHKEPPSANDAFVELKPTGDGSYAVTSLRTGDHAPPHPLELARQVLAQRRPNLSAMEFAAAVEYWARHAQVAP